MTRAVDHTHDPALRSWVESANRPGADFPIQNLPFGVFRRVGGAGPEDPPGRGDTPSRIGVAIGDEVLDLARCAELGLMTDLPETLLNALASPSLNLLMALGPDAATTLRHRLVTFLRAGVPSPDESVLVPIDAIETRLPAVIGNYSDFYASAFHATNVGRLFRPDAPLLPNYKHVPIAYHGRASSIAVSGTAVRRPWGQVKPAGEVLPLFRPSRALDYEVEIGLLIGRGNPLCSPISLDEAEAHGFGVCLLNDWSARDIQAWEYQPLGPFLAKSFATSISPWVITLDALAPFRCAAFDRSAGDPAPLPYLSSDTNQRWGGIDLKVEVWLRSAQMRAAAMEPVRLSHGSLSEMYWTLAQMVTHHTSNGCNLRPGDLIGTGTVSGREDGSLGCLLEITRQGTRSVTLPSGEERGYLVDGDQVTLRGYCERDGYARIGLGSCTGMILPAIPGSIAWD